ncbi:MAG TPA: LysR family transcriptional regulator [Pseudonocardia sp.]|jgi:DNA-binding transcriptional LysR family regulator
MVGATMDILRPVFDPRLARAVVALAEELHFGRAAARLYLAQPALSQQIARAEAQLGVALFVRDSRRVALTAAGEVVMPHCAEIVAAARSAERVARAADRDQCGELLLGATLDATDLLDLVVTDLHRRAPAVRVSSRVALDADLLRALDEGELDATMAWSDLTAPPGGHDTAGSRLLARVESGLVMRRDHPAVDRVAIDLPLPDEEVLVMFPRDVAPHIHDVLLAQLGHAVGHRRILDAVPISTSAQQRMRTLVRTTGVTPNSRYRFHHEHRDDLVYRPTNPPLLTGIWLLWRRRSVGLDALLTLLDQRGVYTDEHLLRER